MYLSAILRNFEDFELIEAADRQQRLLRNNALGKQWRITKFGVNTADRFASNQAARSQALFFLSHKLDPKSIVGEDIALAVKNSYEKLLKERLSDIKSRSAADLLKRKEL